MHALDADNLMGLIFVTVPTSPPDILVKDFFS